MNFKPLEHQIESTVCKYAKDKGFVPLKLELQNDAGWPDRLFLGPNGQHFFIEFKAEGKKEAKIQHHRRMTLLSLGHPSYVADSIKEGKRVVDLYAP